MGFFDFLKYNKAEKELIEIYSQLYLSQGMSSEEAKQTADNLINSAIENSKKAETYNNLPQKIGDIILEKAESDEDFVNKYVESIRQEIPAKRKEGVTDGDILLWWNLCDIERWVILEKDNQTNVSYLVNCIQNHNLSMDDAMSRLRKFYPLYGNPEDTSNTKGNDRPLPYELKDRINTYMRKRVSSDPEKYKKEVEKSSTFNALIRKEIKAGKL